MFRLFPRHAAALAVGVAAACFLSCARSDPPPAASPQASKGPITCADVPGKTLMPLGSTEGEPSDQSGPCSIVLVQDKRLLKIHARRGQLVRAIGEIPAALSDLPVQWSGLETPNGWLFQADLLTEPQGFSERRFLFWQQGERLRTIELTIAEQNQGEEEDVGVRWMLEPWICPQGLGIFAATPAGPNSGEVPHELAIRQGIYRPDGRGVHVTAEPRPLPGCRKVVGLAAYP